MHNTTGTDSPQPAGADDRDAVGRATHFEAIGARRQLRVGKDELAGFVVQDAAVVHLYGLAAFRVNEEYTLVFIFAVDLQQRAGDASSAAGGDDMVPAAGGAVVVVPGAGRRLVAAVFSGLMRGPAFFTRTPGPARICTL